LKSPTISFLSERLAESEARRAALRDIVVRLVAVVSAQLSDDEALLRDIAEHGDRRVADSSPKSEGQIAISAWYQDEIDGVVHNARLMIEDAKRSN